VNCPSCRAENDADAVACTACGTTLAEPTEILVTTVELRAGTVFHGRYEIQSHLGRGGMGTVYRARDRTLDEVVAIKVLRPDFGQDPRMAERFKSEIKLARRVRHKNVCAIHDYGEDRGLLYISMELVEGVDLKKILRERGALPAPQAYELAIQIAEGLQAVHEAGIIHRDLKSPNIMVDGSMARLMDFGVAKRFGEGTVTATGNIVGTPEYMSPEQAQGRKLDFRSDIYALGIVVYEMFTGRVPFRGETPISTILKHINDPPLFDGPPALGIPPDLKPVLGRCLAKDPAERYANARETAEALREARSPSRRQVPVHTDALRAPTLSTGPTLSETRPTLPAGAVPRRSALLQPWLLALAFVAIGGGLAVMRMRSEAPAPVPPATTTAAALPTETPPTVFAVATPLPSSPPTTLAAVPVIPTAVPSPRSPRVSPRPVASAPPAPTVPSTPNPTPTPRVVETVPEAPGMLQVAVKPWGEVSVDGKVMGTTPLDRITLGAGPHVVRVRNPAFELWEGRVVVRPGQTERLLVDLTQAKKQ
jgi:eukaryotic-like serine/threonine-protein kinase